MRKMSSLAPTPFEKKKQEKIISSTTAVGTLLTSLPNRGRAWSLFSCKLSMNNYVLKCFISHIITLCLNSVVLTNKINIEREVCTKSNETGRIKLFIEIQTLKNNFIHLK